MRKSLFSLVALGLGATFAGVAAADALPPEIAAKLSPSLARALSEQSLTANGHDVLVYLGKKADLAPAARLRSQEARAAFVQRALADTAADAQKGVTATLEGAGANYRSYYLANAVAVDAASVDLIKDLAARGDVERIVSDAPVKVVDAPLPEQLQADGREAAAIGENIVQTGADKVWSELKAKGEGIVVAGQDTGIDWKHGGLVQQYRGRGTDGSSTHDFHWHDAIKRNLTDGAERNRCGYALREPCDDNGHGTHTLGTIVGDDGRGNQVGMAPAAKWIGCRNMDAGIGKPSTYLECFQYFLAPWPYGGNPARDGRPELGAHVINNSWGCPGDEGCDGTEFLQVLNTLKEAGIMVVSAAGNAGSGCSTINDAPAHHTDENLVVGAHDHRSGNIASFSSRGPSKFDGKVGPDLTAPGVNVRSTVPGGGYQGTMWSGTSMAAPHVAGAVALLWSARPELKGDVDRTVELLRQTATPKTSTQTCGGVPGSRVPNNTFGHGHLNVYRAATTTF